MSEKNKKILLYSSVSLIVILLIGGSVFTVLNWQQITGSFSASSSSLSSQSQSSSNKVVFDKSYKLNFLPELEIKYNDQWSLDASGAPANSDELIANSYKNQITLKNDGIEIAIGFLTGLGGSGVANCVQSDFPIRNLGSFARVGRVEKVSVDGKADFFAGSYYYTTRGSVVSKSAGNFRQFRERSIKQTRDAFGEKSADDLRKTLDNPKLNLCYPTPSFPYYFNTKSQTGEETLTIELKNINNLSVDQVRAAEELIAQIKL